MRPEAADRVIGSAPVVCRCAAAIERNITARSDHDSRMISCQFHSNK
jgi:hypothetical protein